MVQELVAALSEAQTERRDATRESEALQETCHALSQSLQASEEARHQLMEQLELLQLQMSSVCYVDLPVLRRHRTGGGDKDDDNDAAVMASPAKATTATTTKTLPKEKKLTKKAAVLAARPRVAVAAPADANDSNAGSAVTGEVDDVMPHAPAGLARDTGADRVVDDDTAPPPPADVSVAPATTTSSPLPLSPASASAPAITPTQAAPAPAPAPSQAAFYRVLMERDQARRSADMLRQEVKLRREQVKTLRRQLLQSATLIELSYTPQDADDDGLDSDDDQGSNDDEDDTMGSAPALSSPSKPGSPIKKWLMSKRNDRRTFPPQSSSSTSSSSSSSNLPMVSAEPAPTRQREEPPPALPVPSSPPFANDADDDGRNGENRPGASVLVRPAPEDLRPAASSNTAVPHEDPEPLHGLETSLEDQYIVDLFHGPNDGKRFGRSPSPESVSSSTSTSSSDADTAAGGFVLSRSAEKTTEKEPYGSATIFKGDSPRRRPAHHPMRPSELVAYSPQPENRVNDKVSPRAVKGKLVEL
jgi:hypothetical protein